MDLDGEEENQHLLTEEDDDRKQEAISGGEEKLWISIQGEDKEDPIGTHRRSDQAVAANRVCNVCNKAFSSGKALGGHMRVHVQANKDMSLKKLKPLKIKRQLNHGEELLHHPNAAAASGDDQTKPTCSICQKNFPSMKSLFGHMRCHPERDWRGIQPPPAAKNSSSSSISDCEPPKFNDPVGSFKWVDLTKSLPGWTVTEKRGRKSFVAAEDDDEKLLDAVNDLMMLAHGDSLDSSLTHHKHVAHEPSNSNSLTNNEVAELTIDEIANKIKIEMGKGHGKAILEAESVREKSYGWDWAKESDCEKFTDADVVEEDDDDESDGKISNGSMPSELQEEEEELIMDNNNYKYDRQGSLVMMRKKRKRKMKKVKLMDLESVRDDHNKKSQPVDRYKCSTCNKCFPTHQALGGHRSSHNKINKTLTNSTAPADQDDDDYQPSVDCYNEEENKENEGAGCSSSSSKQVAADHLCKICNKSFPTGQALGGHKRCHWTGAADHQAPNSTQLAAASASPGRRALPFDLNELPAMDYEDGVESHDHHPGGL
ncbi:uncharacterized protein LOC127792304 [Diospyros lotus]|uniref:uncharacterized protein LOC127792304 n=1 Tax=Diospyros lotus TaxID=55363 RepID=UPI002259477C|nr:uncharacterized protein LOC127792304 [Diospyros lotus]